MLRKAPIWSYHLPRWIGVSQYHSTSRTVFHGGKMILGLFESAEQRRKDARDLSDMFEKYGEDLIDVLQARADDTKLRDRDRKHWARLLRKARSQYG